MVLKENEDASSRDFPEQWYDAASEDHFWMEWRARVLSEHLLRVGLDPMAALSAFDIGCGHGAVQRQLTRSTAWIVDGCDLNDRAISRNTGHRGFTLRYNIFDKSPDLRERYDIVFLLDVIEHVKDPVAFLNAAAYYSKPTGVVVINVPSVPSLASAYDKAVGHLRRYTKSSLRRDVRDAGSSHYNQCSHVYELHKFLGRPTTQDSCKCVENRCAWWPMCLWSARYIEVGSRCKDGISPC